MESCRGIGAICVSVASLPGYWEKLASWMAHQLGDANVEGCRLPTRCGFGFLALVRMTLPPTLHRALFHSMKVKDHVPKHGIREGRTQLFWCWTAPRLRWESPILISQGSEWEKSTFLNTQEIRYQWKLVCMARTFDLAYKTAKRRVRWERSS
jgi:hypothetical protein